MAPPWPQLAPPAAPDTLARAWRRGGDERGRPGYSLRPEGSKWPPSIRKVGAFYTPLMTPGRPRREEVTPFSLLGKWGPLTLP